jgi:uncharacterized protein (DUF2141 family)
MRRAQICQSLLPAIVLGLLPLLSASSTGTIDVYITVHGLQTSGGYLRLAIYDSDQNYLRTPVFKTKLPVMQEDVATGMRFTVPLQAGEYAIAMYHDANGNGKFDRGFMGWPIEKFGFSNDIRPKLRAPPFDKVKFTVDRDNHALSIRVE